MGETMTELILAKVTYSLNTKSNCYDVWHLDLEYIQLSVVTSDSPVILNGRGSHIRCEQAKIN